MNLSRLLGCCIALFSAGAFAQENPLLLRVPLFSPGPPIAAADPIHQIPQTKSRDFVAMKAVVLNEDAFGAGAVTVEIDDKVHTFVGGPRPKRHMPPGYGKDHETRWSGEEQDDAYGPSTLSMGKDEISGRASAWFSLPPRRHFMIYGASTIYEGSPTVLVESVSDWSRPPRAPLWLCVGLFPSLVALCLALYWRRSRKSVSSVPPSTSIMALVNASAFATLWMLFFLTLLFVKPSPFLESAYDRAHFLGSLLAIASIGFGLIFWRVRVAYAKSNGSILRAAAEGYCGAAIVILAMEGWQGLTRISQGEMPFVDPFPYGIRYFVERDLVFLLAICLIGAAVGLSLWFANRLLWRSAPIAVDDVTHPATVYEHV